MERGKEIVGEREKGKAIKLSGNQVSYDQADSILLEPWGGTGGSEWNYMLKSPIKEILIAHGDVIDSIMFRTITEQGTTIDSPKFGGDGGRRDKVVIEATPLEYLTGIKGTFGRFYDRSIIKSLCFITNAKNYGPFGCEAAGTPFSLVMEEGVAIVGFHGRSGLFLDAIGVYLQKLAPHTSAKEPMVEDIEIRDVCCDYSHPHLITSTSVSSLHTSVNESEAKNIEANVPMVEEIEIHDVYTTFSLNIMR